MFYFPDKIVLVVENDSIGARMDGINDCCLVDANIPCSLDFKKSAAGGFDNRVRTDAKVTIPWSEDNWDTFQIGAEFIIARLKKTAWVVQDVDLQEGVFGGAQMLELRCTRKAAQLPQVGEASKRHSLANRKAKINRPGGPYGPGTGPGLMQ